MKKTSGDSPKFTSHEIIIIAILAFLQFTVILDFVVISPLGDILMKTLNMTTANFGFAVSAYAFSAGISGLLAAGFADKFDRKKLLIFFYTGFIAGTIFCALSTSYEMLLLARIVTGLFGGVIGSVSLAIVTDLFVIHQRGRVMGFIQMAYAASQILGIPIGLYCANHWGWHSSFLMIASLGVLILVAIITQMQAINKHLELQLDKSPFLHLWHTLSNKQYQIGFASIAFLSIGGFMLQPFGSAFLVNNIHISQLELPMVFFFTGLSVLFIMPLVGKLSDKVSKFKLFAAGSVLSVIMIIIYTNLTPIPLWEVVVLNMILFMGIMSRMIPATTLNTGIPEMKDRGAYMSISSSLQQIAGGIAAVCAGFIVHQETKTSPIENYDILGYVIAVITLLSVFLIWRVNQLVQSKDKDFKE
ncbi:putative MFS family arabinose efflux permease [Flavobacterium sp. 90]|uniref:MFS transporter n=1 Tax=unclassified Flavobacterium TaxID=196869 RepID=UPI000EAF72A3|nr:MULTISPECIES: MFS transporter [unclassified Flavobacterium]RKR11573.1 putative MFS family arabinose efflux permease [Flavobacterium sp. 81]TCK55354.1 putative MFS family arabinose efflux permease [Flavobacterium sp. 90]